MMTQQQAAPLAGVRIIAVEQYGAGPYATLYLADMGAEVIKIEDPRMGGDIGRYVPPGQVGTDSLFFETFNRGKRSLTLDLEHPGGRKVFERLVAQTDAVFNNLRGDVPQKLGLTYEALGPINPAIVCVSLSGYGRSGARRAHPGYDALVQAEAGWATLTGEPDGPPVKTGLSLVDYAAGVTAALALMVALFDAKRTGRGCDVDTSLYDIGIALLTYLATWYLTDGILPERQPLSAHPSIVPFQFFPTADGYLAVACPKEKYFRALLCALGLPELLDDPRFASFDARRANRAALLSILSERFGRRSTAAWVEVLQEKVPVAPVRPPTSALAPDELAARGLLASYAHPTFGSVKTIATPFTIGDFTPSYRPAPPLDGDRTQLLMWLGYKRGEIDALASAGAFGSSHAQAGPARGNWPELQTIADRS